MLIAVGMYLPFYATAGIFVGGVFRAILDFKLNKQQASEKGKTKAENTGVLISSGLIAGGALTAVVIAFLVLGYNLIGTAPVDDPAHVERMAALGMNADELPTFLDSAREMFGIAPNAWLGLIAFLGVFGMLYFLPLKESRDSG